MFGSRILVPLLAAVVFGAGLSTPRPASAAPALLDLSKPPLFLNAAVDPNLMVTFDDSGSMALGYVPDTVADVGCVFRRKRYYSTAFNKQYYDPNISYDPPLDASGKEFPNASFSAASVDGFNSSAATVDLSSQYFVTWEESSTPDRITYQSGATSTTRCGTHTFDFPSGGAKAFYCTLKAGGSATNDADYTCNTSIPSAEQQNFANWFSYYRIRSNTLKSAISRSFGVLDDDLRVGWQNMHKNQIVSTTTIGKFNGTRRTGFFDFLFKSPHSGNTPTLDATNRVNSFFARATGKAETNPYWDQTLGKELSCRQNFHVLVSDGYWNQDPTHPSAGGANATKIARDLPDGKKFLVSDSGDGSHSKIVWNEAARGFNCTTSTDSSGNGIGECTPDYADIAFNAWATDLRPDLNNNVPTYFPDRTTGVTGAAKDISGVKDLRDIPEIYWNPANDPATWQHVVQFFIGFGISGKIPFNDVSLKDLRTGKIKWTGARNNDPESVDDSWHAALASRGRYFGATDPNQIVDALTEILSSIVQRKGTASALSVSTGIVTGDTLSYQTQFDSTDWSGTVLARKVAKDFTFGKPVWDAGCLLTGGDCASTGEKGLAAKNWDTARQIFTSKVGTGSGGAVAFRWGNLSTDQQSLLDKNPSGGKIDSLGSKRVEYLRGSREKERQNGGTFRNRADLFGAVVSSSAAYIGPPRENFDIVWPTGSPEQMAASKGDTYGKFKTDNKSRNMVAVGANDGMMHVLNAATGDEHFAYVPYATYRTLPKLTDPLYQFDPTVDNTPVMRDAFVNGAWRTIMVGTLRRGGQGAFALDVTTSNATETKPADKVLWDLTDAAADGADLGYTYGQPFITRMQNGKWAALLPASYNSQEADTFKGSGNAVLFVVDLETGKITRKFDIATLASDATAVGLASPIAVDLEGDQITDFAYAGDLAGNVWRFDLTSKTPSSWTVSRLFKPEKPFDQPITAQPRALRDAMTGLPMVFVGTGKFIETTDRTTAIPTQAFYGLRDDGSEITAANLDSRGVTTTAGVRKLGTTTAATGANKGWMIKFDEASFKGERVVSSAALRITANEVIFSTLVPSGDDPCVPGGTSFLMFVDASLGGPSPDGVAYFDTNGDGKIDASDDASAVGAKVDALVPGIASILQQGGGVGAVILPPGTGGTDDKPSVLKTREFEWRRRGWRELFRQN